MNLLRAFMAELQPNSAIVEAREKLALLTR
jgi:hypothetical protein